MPANPDPEHSWLTLGELACFLNITERHVRRLVSERRIPVARVGGQRGRLRFNRSPIEAWMRANSVDPDGGGRGRAA